ncbi:MAG: hypothetical protein JNJ57_14480 [Saprospiraceae bacterium]|nr:hypothetical protein [Saprospiraceae bacterium]
MKHFLTMLLCLIMFSACNGNQQKIDNLVKEIDEVHDAAMKDMAEMNRTARSIKEFLISASMTPEQSQEYAKTLKAMGDAENTMMSWMRDSKYNDKETQNAPEGIKYLEEQKKFIQQNHEDIKAATAAGKKMLGE